jgi:type I restriction enzyme M protein
MVQTNANLIWKIADLLRGPYQPNQYGDVILPFTILRRLDCILEPTKDEVLAEYKKIAPTKVDPGVLLKAKFKLPFYNTSRWTFASLIGDPRGRGPQNCFGTAAYRGREPRSVVRVH